MRIAAVTVAYNDYQQLTPFQAHVAEYRDRLALHIVVDNASHLTYRESLHRAFPDSMLIVRRQNGGTTAAYNDGVRYALRHGMDAVLLIAQDVQLPGPALDAMVEVLQQCREVGVVGPVLLRADGEVVEEYGGRIDPATLQVTKLCAGHALDGDLPDELAVDFVAGGVNLTRREVFERVGLQDERLFMYGDETDFDLRVRRAGWTLVVTRLAVATHAHQGGVSTLRPQSLYLWQRNQLWLVRKHLGRRALGVLALRRVLGLPRRIGHYLKRRRLDLAWAHTRALAHGIWGR